MREHLQHRDGMSQPPQSRAGETGVCKGNLIRWMQQRQQGAILMNVAPEAKFLFLALVGGRWVGVESGRRRGGRCPARGSAWSRREPLREAPQN